MTTARDLIEEGDAWTDQAARGMLPILVDRALQGRRVTYGDVRELLFRHNGVSRAHATTYGHPAGKIGNALIQLSEEWGSPVPPLNAILVRKDTNLPGDGADYFMKRFVGDSARGRLSNNDRDALAEATIQTVFDYPRLHEIGQYFGVTDGRRREPEPENTPISRPPKTSYGRGGEGLEHKHLKAWISQHPELFRQYGRYPEGTQEKYLDSGDEVDVLFSNAKSWLGVEVKTADAPEGELWRGIFQCVKYRAVLRAMAITEAQIPNVQAVLAIECTPPPRVRQLARRLNVEWLNVLPFRR